MILGSTLAKRTLRRRVIALAAAYAIALSGLIGSVNVARAAAAEAGGGLPPLCHTVAGNALAGDARAGTEAVPSPGENNGAICADCCCAGCLILVAALPPPPAIAIAALAIAGSRMTTPANAGLSAPHQDKAHRSRAPPLTA